MRDLIQRGKLLYVVFLYLMFVYLTCFLSYEMVAALTDEDAFYENISAIYLLTCSILFFLSYFGSSRSISSVNSVYRKNIFYLILGILFFVGCMEEISWGQRLFNVKVPDELLEYNMQREINIHNLKWFHGFKASGERKSFLELLFNVDRLFSLFWLGFCFLIPLLNKYNVSAQKLLHRIRFPIVPLPFGVFLIANYLTSKILGLLDAQLLHPAIELKEHNIAFIFLCIAALELQKTRSNRASYT